MIAHPTWWMRIQQIYRRWKYGDWEKQIGDTMCRRIENQIEAGMIYGGPDNVARRYWQRKYNCEFGGESYNGK